MLSFMKSVVLLVLLVTNVAVGQTCGPDNGDITISGSNIVEVIARAWETGYEAKCPTVNVTVEAGTTAAGAERVCANNTRGATSEIGTLSRLPLATESTSSDQVNYTCVTGNKTRETVLLEVALDGLTVAAVAGGFGARCIRLLGGLTIDQVRWIFSSYTAAKLTSTGWDPTSLKNSDNNESTHYWSELDPGCQPTEIKIAGRDLQSGTASSFRDAVFKDARNGETFASKRPDGYFNSSSDAAVVNFVQTSSELQYGDAVAYFGFSFYLNEGQTLYGAPIKNSAGTYVVPTQASIKDGSYNPLSRSLYVQVYKDPASLADTRPFFNFAYSAEGTTLLESTGYVSFDVEKRNVMLARLGLPALPVPPPAAAPAGSPVASPVTAPSEDKSCGLLGLSIFCPLSFCGLFGRLLGLCN
jgi:ABC-type phosphate transport system substrate-binding protein